MIKENMVFRMSTLAREGSYHSHKNSAMNKRYGFIHVDRDDEGNGTLER